jgi:hypothetical protein
MMYCIYICVCVCCLWIQVPLRKHFQNDWGLPSKSIWIQIGISASYQPCTGRSLGGLIQKQGPEDLARVAAMEIHAFPVRESPTNSGFPIAMLDL